jgi:hypothetical protein
VFAYPYYMSAFRRSRGEIQSDARRSGCQVPFGIGAGSTPCTFRVTQGCCSFFSEMGCRLEAEGSAVIPTKAGVFRFRKYSETVGQTLSAYEGAMAQRFTQPRSGYGTDPGMWLVQSETRIDFVVMDFVESRCAQCQEPVPHGRTRFCSDQCLVRHKREQERLRYGHRHEYQCAKCGHQLLLGRRKSGPGRRISSMTLNILVCPGRGMVPCNSTPIRPIADKTA